MHSTVVRVVAMYAAVDLFWRPAAAQPRGHVVSQDRVLLQLQSLWSVSSSLRTIVGVNGPIGFVSFVAPDFTAERRWRPVQLFRDAADRATSSDPARNL